jgi:hypothetical protein
MNQAQWISVISTVLLAVLYWLALEQIKGRLAAPLFCLFRPLLELIAPVFRMKPWLFEPIDASELPPKQRRHFETHTPGFITRGFTHLGDFVLRRDGQPSCTRFFISRDGTAIGEITWYLGDPGIGCVSVLLDGLYIESSTTNCPRLPPEEHGLQFLVVKPNDALAVIDQHAAFVAQKAAERTTAPAPLDTSDLKAAVNYGRQLSLRSLTQQGFLPELPEFLRGKEKTGPIQLPA